MIDYVKVNQQLSPLEGLVIRILAGTARFTEQTE